MKSEFIKSFHPSDMKSFLFLYLDVFRFDSHTFAGSLFSFQSSVKLSSLSFSFFSWEIAQIYIHVLACHPPFFVSWKRINIVHSHYSVVLWLCRHLKIIFRFFSYFLCGNGENPCCKWKPISRINTFLSFFVYHIPQALTFFIRQHK